MNLTDKQLTNIVSLSFSIIVLGLFYLVLNR
jgi:hypothetical protein